jgi:hypothetical protein
VRCDTAPYHPAVTPPARAVAPALPWWLGLAAVLLAALATALGPFFLRTANMFAIPSFEPLWWTLMALLLVRILEHERPRGWLWFGAAIALGLFLPNLLWLPGLFLLLRRPGAARVLGVAFVTALAVAAPGLPLLPLSLSLPVLPIATLDRFATAATFGLVAKAHEITGDLHFMYGWPEVAHGMAAAEAALPAADRGRLLRFVNCYAVAGALERFAPSKAPILCNHMSWHFWSRELAANWPQQPSL